MFHERISIYGLRETMFDTCEAYFMYYALYHNGGLTARCRKTGRGIAGQLSKMEFRPAAGLSIGTLTENGIDILSELVKRYEGEEQAKEIRDDWEKENQEDDE